MPTSPSPAPRRRLEIGSCRSECAWSMTADRIEDEPVFACRGCGSEWVPSEPWTPVDWTGQVPDAVQRARRSRGRG